MIAEIKERIAEHTARGLAGAVNQAIRDGVLIPGTKLPPVRQVADGLGLSPTTVNAAWQLLARSGVLHADGRRGTTVADPRPTGPRRYWQAGGRVADIGLDLATSEPDPALLPDLGPALSRLHTTPPGAYLDDSVLPALEGLLRERWPYPVEQLTVVDGAMDAMDLLAASLLRIGDRVVVEDPAFPHLIDLLDVLGTQVIGVPLDGEGPRPDRLRDVLESSKPAAVFLQPRAHNPAGISWTPQRAAELASVLAEFPGSVVIEDDAGGDVAAAPPISLGTWLPDRTIHIHSFSKAYGPELRLAAMGGPATLIGPVVERRLLGQGWTSRLLQNLLLNLLTDEHSVAQVQHARQEYRRRRDAVTEALAVEGIQLAPGDGINLWLPVHDEQVALISLASHGIGAIAGTGFMIDLSPGQIPHVRIAVGLAATGHAELAHHLAIAARAGRRSRPR
ncbi:aminotransferase-like domain-containing protein [Nonomuraea sediminis]|uniref:aminotransferase-like domain-containing protein n=1 Tax=Nonomuraea sediminis TaxID=2835864 RepID=UPI001BDD4A7F|nr:aminotransferase class I/II-fold pyridoxal phosphate-dependent enzyme [Nonomuraea sediminis]